VAPGEVILRPASVIATRNAGRPELAATSVIVTANPLVTKGRPGVACAVVAEADEAATVEAGPKAMADKPAPGKAAPAKPAMTTAKAAMTSTTATVATTVATATTTVATASAVSERCWN